MRGKAKKVKYYKWENGVKKYAGIAEFIRFAPEYEETDKAVGNYIAALIKLKDGAMKNVGIELIRFVG